MTQSVDNCIKNMCAQMTTYGNIYWVYYTKTDQ